MERKKEGKLKLKTEIAGIVFFIILAALGMSTYSWYLVSTAPSVRAIETYMAVIDPMLSIARATDRFTIPADVNNEDARVGDTTWGRTVTSYQDDTIAIEFPATLDHEEDLATVEIDESGRLGWLEKLECNDIGEELKYPTNQGGSIHREPIAGIRYYTSPSTGKVCAVGLGVWAMINQPDRDLVVSASNVTVKNAAGEDVVDDENVGVAYRLVNLTQSDDLGMLFPAGYNEEKGTQSATIFDHELGNPFPENTPILVEIIVYLDGSTETTEEEKAAGKKKGVIAADISQQLYINIESVTFYDNTAFDASRASESSAEE